MATQAAARQMATYISLSHPSEVDGIYLDNSSLTHTFFNDVYIQVLTLSCETATF